MARLTIEDKWWTDPRREKLGKILGGQHMADGAAIRLWKLAQDFWGDGFSKIPRRLFEVLDGAPALVEARLVTVDEDLVYVHGSSEYLSWLHEKRMALVAAGMQSAKRPRDKKGRLLPKPKAADREKTSSTSPTDIQQTSNTSPTGDQQGSSLVQCFGSGSGSVSGLGLELVPNSNTKESLLKKDLNSNSKPSDPMAYMSDDGQAYLEILRPFKLHKQFRTKIDDIRDVYERPENLRKQFELWINADVLKENEVNDLQTRSYLGKALSNVLGGR